MFNHHRWGEKKKGKSWGKGRGKTSIRATHTFGTVSVRTNTHTQSRTRYRLIKTHTHTKALIDMNKVEIGRGEGGATGIEYFHSYGDRNPTHCSAIPTLMCG